MKKKISARKKEFEKRLSDYKKFLKDDHDWDWAYILRLLKYKLERTRKCIVSNHIVQSAPKKGRQIKAVEDLLERVLKDKYYDKISKNFHRKNGHLKMLSGKAEKGAQSIPVIFKYTRETPANREKIRRESFKLHKKADRLKNIDLKKAFDLICKNIWNWWD